MYAAAFFGLCAGAFHRARARRGDGLGGRDQLVAAHALIAVFDAGKRGVPVVADLHGSGGWGVMDVRS